MGLGVFLIFLAAYGFPDSLACVLPEKTSPSTVSNTIETGEIVKSSTTASYSTTLISTTTTKISKIITEISRTKCDCSSPNSFNTGFLNKLQVSEVSDDGCLYEILCAQNQPNSYLAAGPPSVFTLNPYLLTSFRFYPVFNGANKIDYFSQFGMQCGDDQDWYITKIPGMVDLSPGANEQKVNGTMWNGMGYRFRITEMQCFVPLG
ncbi:Fibrinogen C-terminal domain-containing protein [Caenorhabditis elegans]|uniref:Fibrinogen C-terminal domain-containing protein n=1 Tax=Caenorhabditis elegans TaxID=6239 RepID=Q9NA60_CAEEL|nr:Fibrinogen C-terminal domain-containing protein [Caenorhabditis elegans]CAB60535.2 Fibrinogen C-terminal domain-containing protein [Caenorhabditis elegans]|eukprot:NP_502845.2 Uncharacterized protein CELE_Y73F8A.10 [Caenorhabditis elegans]